MTKGELEQEIIDEVYRLRKECLNKISKITENSLQNLTSVHNVVNKTIAIIREYGRIWDKKAEEKDHFKKGGFVIIMKKGLIETEGISELFKNALFYL